MVRRRLTHFPSREGGERSALKRPTLSLSSVASVARHVSSQPTLAHFPSGCGRRTRPTYVRRRDTWHGGRFDLRACSPKNPSLPASDPRESRAPSSRTIPALVVSARARRSLSPQAWRRPTIRRGMLYTPSTRYWVTPRMKVSAGGSISNFQSAVPATRRDKQLLI